MASANGKSLERVAFSPGEFAALFGKSQTWGYRQIYAGKAKTVTEYGRIMIPAAEVDRILATAGVYNGIKFKTPKTKAELLRLAPKLGEAWQNYLLHRRDKDGVASAAKSETATTGLRRKLPWDGKERKAAVKRLQPRNPKA